MNTRRQDYLDVAAQLKGSASAMDTTNPLFAELIRDAANKLSEAGRSICAQGYFGCRDQNCTSDHK